MGNTRRKLYDKISISGDVIEYLDRLREQLTQQDENHKKQSYNTVIRYLISRQTAE